MTMTNPTTTETHTYRCGHPCKGGKFMCEHEDRHPFECDDCFAVSQKRLAAVRHDPNTNFENGYGSGRGGGEFIARLEATATAAAAAEAMHDDDDAQVAGY